MAPLLVLWLAGGLAAAPTPREAAWHQARAALERAQFQTAAKIIDDALTRNPGEQDRWYWELRVLRSLTVRPLGPKTVAALQFDLPAELRESPTAVRRLLNLGIAGCLAKDAKVCARLAAARELSKKYPETQPEVYAWSALIAGLGSRAAGEAYARQALQMARAQGDESYEMFALNELGYDCALQGRFVEAIHWWEETLLLAQRRQVDLWIQKAQGNLGWMYIELGDYETAAQMFEAALKTVARVNSPGDLVKWTNQRGNVALQLRDYVTAERFFLQSFRLAGWKLSSDLGYALANLARVALEQKLPVVAQCRNDLALAVKSVVGKPRDIQSSHILNAQIASMSGRFDEALGILRTIAAEAADISIQWEAQGLMAEVLRDAGRDGEAEVQFRNAIATVRAARKSITDSALQLTFFRMAEGVLDAYVDFLVSRGRADHALDVTESIRAQTLEEALGIRQERKAALDPRSLARSRNATILCYWLGRTKSYLWVVTPGGVTVRTLPPEREIVARVDAYQRMVVDRTVDLDRMRVPGAALYRILVAPAAAAIASGGSRVIVVPDGRLHVLNMESLIVPGGGAIRFWIKDVMLFSASSLELVARDAPRTTGNRALLMVGNPELADDTYPPLRKAKVEMEKVGRHFPRPVVLEGPRATPAAFRDASPGTFDYLHFVAHGEATSSKPLDAAVILGKDQEGMFKLFARDIAGHRLAARLVTVSSCHGAGTRTFVGEGLVGLAWAFLRAGARQVVAALWEVDDNATPDFMNDLYAGIEAGKDPATALRDAKLRRVDAQNIQRKPFYWAPFVLYGGM